MEGKFKNIKNSPNFGNFSHVEAWQTHDRF
jgi:hypothetical protein